MKLEFSVLIFNGGIGGIPRLLEILAATGLRRTIGRIISLASLGRRDCVPGDFGGGGGGMGKEPTNSSIIF